MKVESPKIPSQRVQAPFLSPYFRSDLVEERRTTGRRKRQESGRPRDAGRAGNARPPPPQHDRGGGLVWAALGCPKETRCWPPQQQQRLPFASLPSFILESNPGAAPAHSSGLGAAPLPSLAPLEGDPGPCCAPFVRPALAKHKAPPAASQTPSATLTYLTS